MKKSIKINALFNLLSSIMSVIFPLLTFPYVSRIFGVEQLGNYNFSKNMVEMFSYVAMLGIPTYAAREGARIREDRKKISEFGSEIFSLNIVSTVIVLVFLYGITFTFDAFQSYKALIVIFSIMIPMTTVGISWLWVVYEDYVFTSVLSVFINTLSVVSMFLLVKTREDVIIYAWITVIASCGANLIRFFYSRKYCDIRLTFRIKYKEHFMPILMMFSAYLSVMIYNKTDTALLGLMCSDYNVGIYSVSTKVYSLVKSCLLAVASVLQTRAVILASSDDTETRELYLSKSFNMLLILAVPCMFGMAFMNHDIIEFIAGLDYLEAGPSMIILSVSLFFALFSTFYSSCVLIPHDMERTTLIGATVGAAVNLLLNFIMIPLFLENGAALTTLIAEITVFVIYLKITYKYFHHIGVVEVAIKTVLSSMGIGAVLWLLAGMQGHILIRVFVKISLAAIVYVVLQVLLRNPLVIDMLKSYGKKVLKR